MDGYSLENVGLLTCADAGFRDMTISTILVSTINGASYPPPPGPAAWISTATSDLNMNLYNISNVQQGGFREITSSTISVSTINGFPFAGSGSSSWVSTATSDLNMNLYNISSVQRVTTNNITCVGTVTTAAVAVTGATGLTVDGSCPVLQIANFPNSGLIITNNPVGGTSTVSIGNVPVFTTLYTFGTQSFTPTVAGTYNSYIFGGGNLLMTINIVDGTTQTGRYCFMYGGDASGGGNLAQFTFTANGVATGQIYNAMGKGYTICVDVIVGSTSQLAYACFANAYQLPSY
jgi:hypothetical protein